MSRIGLLLIAALSCGCTTASPMLRPPDCALVYQPTPYPTGNWTPEQLSFEDAWFASADGTKLHGWYCPCERPRAVLLFAHGNGGNLSYRWPKMVLFQNRLNVAAMIFDYRGYGRSEGVPTEDGILADARAGRRWLAERTGLPEQEIIIMGESLGGGVAVGLAAKDGARGLVFKSTFTSLPDVAGHLLPYTPARYLMTNQFDSIHKIGQYQGPLLLAHGDADPLIPIEQGRKLFDAAPGPKSMATIPGAGHNWVPTPEYVEQLDQFIAAVGVPPRR